jgi:hypothetical protein
LLVPQGFDRGIDVAMFQHIPPTQRPGERRDSYRLLADHWHEIVVSRAEPMRYGPTPLTAAG